MIAYNHEPHIGRAVQSVLDQDTPFRVELVVGEDCSTDGTRAVLEEYARRYPDRVRLLLAEENRGMMANFMATLSACDGRYVALCEGDDYWVDARKLLMQVSYMEAHPAASVCFHNAWVEDEEGRRTLFHARPRGRVSRGRDLLKQWLMPTASVLFRNPGFADFPAFFAHATHGDLALFLLLAEGGTLDYLDEVMSVYRRHPGGVTTSFHGIAFNLRQLRFLREMDGHFGGRYADLIGRRISALHRSNAIHMTAAGDRRGALRELTASWSAFRGLDARAVRESLQVLLGVALPRAYGRLRSRVRGEP